MKRLVVKLSDEGKEALDRVAGLQQRQVADVVRDALNTYLVGMGISVDLKPGEWGGNRKDNGKGQANE